MSNKNKTNYNDIEEELKKEYRDTQRYNKKKNNFKRPKKNIKIDEDYEDELYE